MKTTNPGNVIYFYHLNEPYGCFSNFAPYPIVVDAKQWPTSEHYFQAQKFSGTEYAEQIRLAKSAREAFNMGRNPSWPVRTDWQVVRDDVMRKAVRAKFEQHSELASVLRETGDSLLVEHTENDSYWGDGGDGSGKNMLGIILMEVREHLK